MDKEWSGTASASGETEILKFSWPDYINALVKRLSKDDQANLVKSIKSNAAKHFWH